MTTYYKLVDFPVHLFYCHFHLIYVCMSYNQPKEFKPVFLTMRRGHILPRSVQTHPSDEDPEWTNHVSGTQNYPWSQPRRDLASERETERETVEKISNMLLRNWEDIITLAQASAFVWVNCAHQKWTEEDERHEVEVCEVCTTFFPYVFCRGVVEGHVRFTLLLS